MSAPLLALAYVPLLREEVIPGAYLPALASALGRFARGEPVGSV